MQKYVWAILIVAVGLFAANRFFGDEPEPAVEPASQAGQTLNPPGAQTVADDDAPAQPPASSRASTRTHSSDAAEDHAASRDITHAPPPVASATVSSNDPHAIFTDYAAPIGDRFAALAQLGANHNKDAQYYALQIARHCAEITKQSEDQAAMDSGDQAQLRSRLQAACVQVQSDAAYPQYAKALQDKAPQEFISRMRQTLELFYADKGPKDAMRVAVSAVAQHPDDLTVDRVGDVLESLDISSVYFRPDMVAQAPADPAKRNELMRYAINLLSCQMGRPCGPGSFAVQSACLKLGACAPGVNLRALYQSQLLDAREMAYVDALLKYLETIPANVYW